MLSASLYTLQYRLLDCVYAAQRHFQVNGRCRTVSGLFNCGRESQTVATGATIGAFGNRSLRVADRDVLHSVVRGSRTCKRGIARPENDARIFVNRKKEIGKYARSKLQGCGDAGK